MDVRADARGPPACSSKMCFRWARVVCVLEDAGEDNDEDETDEEEWDAVVCMPADNEDEDKAKAGGSVCPTVFRNKEQNC